MEKNVRLTRNLIKEIFNHCNESYFEGKITMPDYIELWTPNRDVVGWVRGFWVPKKKGYATALHISNAFHWTRTDLTNTIAHEMIHLLIEDYKEPLPFWKRWFGKDHDRRFKEVMQHLNTTYGLNISVRVPYMKKKRIQKREEDAL